MALRIALSGFVVLVVAMGIGALPLRLRYR